MTRVLLMVCSVSVLLIGCGSDDARVNTSQPEAVAREYYATFFRCAPSDPGLRYDLSTSPDRDWSRATYVRRDKCQPTTVPDIDAVLAGRAHDQARVVLTGQHILTPLTLVRQDDGAWRVDTSRSTIPWRAP